MKRTICVLLCLVFLACQPTPDHEYVITKTDPVREEALLYTAAPADGADSIVLIAEHIGAPERWTEEPIVKTVPYDTLTVLIDAAVHIPDTARVGVYLATFDVPFSEPQQKALIAKFLGSGQSLTVVEDPHRWRKWEIEEEIVTRHQQLEQASNFEDPEARAVLTEQADEQLRMSMESYRNAPEDWTHTPWNGKYVSGRGESAGILQLYAATDQSARYRTLMLWAYGMQYRDETLPMHENYDFYPSGYGPRTALRLAPQTDAERAAVELAKSTVDLLGVGSFLHKSITQGAEGVRAGTNLVPNGYIVYLFLTMDGLPFYDFQAWHGNDNLKKDESPDDAVYSGYLPSQTSATVGVIGGELAFLNIDGWQTVQACVNENAQLLPFSEIAAIFCQQIGYRYYTGDEDRPNSGNGETIHITDAYLSMMRVRKKGTSDEFYLLPVWDFVGYTEYDAFPFTEQEREDQTNLFTMCTFLTVNAIDGTLIDRGVGY